MLNVVRDYRKELWDFRRQIALAHGIREHGPIKIDGERWQESRQVGSKERAS